MKVKRTSVRYYLMQDEDSHWYLVPQDREDEFNTLSENEDEWEAFEDEFGGCRIDGPHRLTFTDPRED